MANAHNHGFEEGEKCNRDKCEGIIEEREKSGCACHINPPCGACTEPRAYCETCDWDEKNDYDTSMNGFVVKVDSKTGNHNSWKRRELDPTKIDYHILSHTNATQKCVGVYPEGTSKDDVLAKVRGTFGGRFEGFGGGKFTYIAYTD